jgi:surface antigen
LLSSQRYEQINDFLNGEYRNNNLLYIAYSSNYLAMKYELQQILNKEEELISMIASEDYSRATIKVDDDINAATYYITHCTSIEINKETKYYLPIGIFKNNIV